MMCVQFIHIGIRTKDRNTCSVSTLRALNSLLTLRALRAFRAGIAFFTLLTFQISGRSTRSRSNRQDCSIPTMGYGSTVFAVNTIFTGCAGQTLVASRASCRNTRVILSDEPVAVATDMGRNTILAGVALCACLTSISLVTFGALFSLFTLQCGDLLGCKVVIGERIAFRADKAGVFQELAFTPYIVTLSGIVLHQVRLGELRAYCNTNDFLSHASTSVIVTCIV